MMKRLSGFFRRQSAPRSLRRQLLAASLLILSSLLLLIGVLQYVLMRNFIYSNRAEAMDSQLRSVPREFFYALYSGEAGFSSDNTAQQDSSSSNSTNEEGQAGSGLNGGAPGSSPNSGGQSSGGTGASVKNSSGSLSPGSEGPGGSGGNPESGGSGSSPGADNPGDSGAPGSGSPSSSGSTTPGTNGPGGSDGSGGGSPGSSGPGSSSSGSGFPNGNSLRTSEGKRPLLLDAHTTIAVYSSDGTFKDLQEDTLSESAAPRLSNEEYNKLLNHASDKANSDYKLITASDGSQHLAVFMNLDRPGGTHFLLQMSVETGQMRDVIVQQLLIFAALSLVALLTGLFLYLPALRKTLVPLSNMGDAAQSIDAGNLDVRFPVDQGQLEIDKLSHSFNGMLERLEISFRNEREAKEQMRRFAADASHELRTPLTSIHGFLEVLLRGAADNKEQLYNALKSMHGESKRINKLVEDLLLLARMDGAPQLRVKKLLLGEVIDEMQPQLLVLAGDRQVTFDISYGIRGMYDPDKIKQVILNLFHNAVQHTHPEQGEIHIALHARNTEARLTVRDNGSGISADHLPHVFDRFYRSDSSRTRKYGGSGLGLSITQSIVEAHEGEISVESTLGKGTTFIVSLPCLLD